MQLPKLGKYYSKLLFVKDGLTLVPWVEKVHLFVAVLAKDPRQTLFQFMQLPKLGKYCSKVIIKNVSSSCQRWSYLGSLGWKGSLVCCCVGQGAKANKYSFTTVKS
jgi:hypothetical protein